MHRRVVLIVVVTLVLSLIGVRSQLLAATTMTIGSGTANVTGGTVAVNVPVSFSLSAGSVSTITLQILYDSKYLSLANTDVTGGSLVPPISSWELTSNATPGRLNVTVNNWESSLDAPPTVSGRILELNFHANQGVSGFVPIKYLTPTNNDNQFIINTFFQNLASTTTFNNGGINVNGGGNTWISPLSGSWNTPTNWEGNLPPVHAGDWAVFRGAPTSTLSVRLDTPQVAGELMFSNSGSILTGYSLTPGGSDVFGGGTGSLTLENTGSLSAGVQVMSGSHSISAPITLADNLDVHASLNSYLTVSGNIGQNTTASMTKSGDGMLTLSGTHNTYSGGTLVQRGTLVLTNAGALPNGTSLTIGAGATVIYDPSFSAGSVELSNPLGSASTTLGGITAFQPASSGQILSSGATAVPEPGTIALLVSGAAFGFAMCIRRRRQHRTSGFPA